MPDLLLELRSEEIPARMQRKAAGDLKKAVTDGLVAAGLTYEAAREYWTPRRLTLDIRGVTARSRDIREERKGPSTKAPEQAIQGFLRGAGLASIEEAHVHSDPKKGDFYVAHIVKPGRAADAIIATLVPEVIRTFAWPKSMRWGKASAKPGSLRWVRPLQSIVCTFGPETEEPVVVDFEVDGIRSGNVTYGHRFHAPGAISVRRFDDYVAKLEAAKVIVDGDRRKQIILADARNLAFASGLELVEDEGLLEEVSGLVEWPVVLMGAFEQDFLQIPAEVIRLTIRANQKCFVTKPVISPLVGEMSAEPTEGGAVPPASQNAGEGRSTLPPSALPGISPTRGEISQPPLSNRFVLVSNIEASDGGREIAHGNGKVVRARLSDALYFWKTDQGDVPDLGALNDSAQKFGLDLKKPLDQRMARLDHLNVTFHAKLGTQGERVERIARLAEELAPIIEASTSPLWGGRAEGAGRGGSTDVPPPLTPPHKGEGNLKALARRAAVLAKADLQTEVVGEFPELQGAMGRKYAALQGEHRSVAAAIEEHYKPQGPSDWVPTDPVSIAVALADKLDTLVGFWAIDEKPTGSKDPFALRRAALGVIRILVENGVRLGLGAVIEGHLPTLQVYSIILSELEKIEDRLKELYEDIARIDDDTRSPINSTRGAARVRMDELQRWVSGHEETRDILREAASSMRSSTLSNTEGLLSFFHDRLKVYLRDQGARYDLIDAVLASGGAGPSSPAGPSPRKDGEKEDGRNADAPTSPLRGGRAAGAGGGKDDTHDTPTPALRADPPLKGEGTNTSSNDDLLTIVRRVEALGKFLDSEDGKNLLAGTKRAANIVAAEEKKGTAIAEAVDAALFREEAEKNLFAAVNQAERQAVQAIQNEDFSAALAALSALREPVDSFFERVLVNDEDAAVRANRLALLSRIRAATGQVADFSKIAG